MWVVVVVVKVAPPYRTRFEGSTFEDPNAFTLL